MLPVFLNSKKNNRNISSEIVSYDVKVLDLFTAILFFEDCDNEKEKLETFISLGKEIAPVFLRNGYYYCRHSGICWAEFNGRAVEMRSSYFIHNLNLLLTPRLSRKQILSLIELSDSKILNKNQKKLLFFESHFEELRLIKGYSRFFVYCSFCNKKSLLSGKPILNKEFERV